MIDFTEVLFSSSGIAVSLMGFFHPIFFGRKSFRIPRIHITDSIDPDALVVWPVNDLVEEKSGRLYPQIRSIAASSHASLFGVPVPWAFI